MPVSLSQKTAAEEVLNLIYNLRGHRKRLRCEMFLDLVDRNDWPEYYEVIPEPRCLNIIKETLAKNKYNDALEIYNDLAMVFWNALFYNEEGSQIAKDASDFKDILNREWAARPTLPQPRSTSPLPSSPQKVHKVSPSQAKPASSATLIAAAPAAPPPAQIPAKAPPKPAPPPPLKAPVPVPAALPPVLKAGSSAAPVAVAQPTPPPTVYPTDGTTDSPINEPLDAWELHVVSHLQDSLPLWPGFGEKGWYENDNPDRWTDIFNTIKNATDMMGERYAEVIDQVPELLDLPCRRETEPFSLKIVEDHLKGKEYTSSSQFDKDVTRLFERARRHHTLGTREYLRVLLLQRYYQAVTSTDPPPTLSTKSLQHLSYYKFGPGTTQVAERSVEGISDEIKTEGRHFIDELWYKGWCLKMGDWVHLSNPDNPGMPIVGHVHRCWTSDEAGKVGKAGVTVSWYFQSGQTAHFPRRTFWEGEVFMSQCFAEHPLEDILEKVYAQFLEDNILGRPRAPYWYPGLPLYVYAARYNDREKTFEELENGQAFLPLALRGVEVPIYPFEDVIFPARVSSPFRNGTALLGTGGPINHDNVLPKKGQDPNTRPIYRKDYISQYRQRTVVNRSRPDRSVLTVAGGSSLANNAHVEKLAPEIASHFDRDPDTNEVLWYPGPPGMALVTQPAPKHSMAYLQFLAKKRKRESDESEDTASQPPRIPRPTFSQLYHDILGQPS